MRVIGWTAFRLAVATAGGQRKRTAHLLEKRSRESPARKEGILELRPGVEDVGRMAHEFFHGRPTGVRRCNAWWCHGADRMFFFCLLCCRSLFFICCFRLRLRRLRLVDLPIALTSFCNCCN